MANVPPIFKKGSKNKKEDFKINQYFTSSVESVFENILSKIQRNFVCY